MSTWNYDNLQNWIKEGCDENIGKNVFSLNLTAYDLKIIPKEVFKLTELTDLYCIKNKIKKIPKEIRYLTQLQTFYCGHNQIKKIPKEIRYSTQLIKFVCFDNQIKKIPKEISYLTQLQILNFGSNKINKIPKEIRYLSQMINFYCDSNQIKEIPKEICYLIQLQIFLCHNNQIKEIPKEIRYLIQLQIFYCGNNQIKEIPIEIIDCINLTNFDYSNNEINYIQPQIIRWLNRMYHEQQIYSDTQSVHNHSIQEGVSKSINYITSIKPSIQVEQLKELIINNPYLDENIKRLLFEYVDNKEVHSILNITFEELLLSVYDFIEKNENKEELFKIMNDEMTEANCKCFTGRISRLINVLNGYDEHVEIHIADNEQIGNIIILIKNDLGENYDEDEFKRRVHAELTMRYYSEDVINEWIDNI